MNNAEDLTQTFVIGHINLYCYDSELVKAGLCFVHLYTSCPVYWRQNALIYILNKENE